MEPANDAQGSGGLNIRLAILDQHEGIKIVGRQSGVAQQFLPCIRLQRGESEMLPWIATYGELNDFTAKMAFAVEQIMDELFMGMVLSSLCYPF